METSHNDLHVSWRLQQSNYQKREGRNMNTKWLLGFTVNCCQSPVPKAHPKTLTLKTDMIEYIMACQLKKLGLCQGTI